MAKRQPVCEACRKPEPSQRFNSRAGPGGQGACGGLDNLPPGHTVAQERAPGLSQRASWSWPLIAPKLQRDVVEGSSVHGYRVPDVFFRAWLARMLGE